MNDQNHPTRIEVNLTQFEQNLRIIKNVIGKRLLCLPVKANAYGHGLIEMGKSAVSAGVDVLGVAHPKEGALLRRGGLETRILVFGPFFEDQIDELTQHGLEFSISSKEQVDILSKHLRKKCKVHLKVETGMQRTGVTLDHALELFLYLKQIPLIEIVGVYSHLATSETPDDSNTLRQIFEFKKLTSDKAFNGVSLHLANSGGVLHYPESYLDMVRPGIISYGYLPENAPLSFRGIAPCLSLKSKVSFSKKVPMGTGIGYGRTYVADKQTGIATVPIGYGDGYLRTLSNRGSVLIWGQKCPIVGSICMDQLMVNTGPLQCEPGDEVILIGEEIKLAEIAKLSHTIVYEIMCLLNDRISRNYYYGDNIPNVIQESVLD